MHIAIVMTSVYAITWFGSIMWGSKYDVAHMNWGGMRRMPTHAQFMELIDNCTYDWAEIDHVRGYIFISKINSNSIFSRS